MVPQRNVRLGFKLFCVATFVVLILINLKSALECSKVEMTKHLISPFGGSRPKFDVDVPIRSFSNISKVCQYRGSKVVCPDVRGHGETVLRQAQLGITRMLRVMDLISRQHNINFWLCSGSLLGAVRHQGFIPWDNDADICMLRDDYQNLVKLGVSDLPKDIFFQNQATDPEFKKYMANDAKLRDNIGCYGRCIRRGCKFHDGYQVDIFVFDQKKEGILEDAFKRFKLKYNDIFPLEELYFEGFRMPVPRNSRGVLADQYGKDFMEMPSLTQRCPPGTMLGVPWYSCSDLERMPLVLQTSIVKDTLMADSAQLTYLWYFE